MFWNIVNWQFNGERKLCNNLHTGCQDVNSSILQEPMGYILYNINPLRLKGEEGKDKKASHDDFAISMTTYVLQ